MILSCPESRIFNHDIGFYIRYKNSACDFIPIPKNSSTYVESFFDIALGEKSYENFKYQNSITPKKTIVVLRDPVDRWVSGVVHHFYLAHRNIYEVIPETIWEYVSNQIVLDVHTELQSRFLENLNTDDIIFFRQDVTLKDRLEEFIKFELNVSDDTWNKKKLKINYNSSTSVPYKNKLKRHISGLLSNDTVLLNRIKKMYEPDIGLFNSVNFHKNSKI
jgi:hypothetical protein